MILASSLALCPAAVGKKVKAPGKAATHVRENAATQSHPATVERGWLRFLEDTSMWWDNRKTKTNHKYPDFVYATCFCPRWVQPNLNYLQDCPAPGRGVSSHNKKIVGACFRSGTPFYGAGRAGNADTKALPQRNDILWTKLIAEHTKCGQGKKALRIYKEMIEAGVAPKRYTFVAALKACSVVSDLEAGKEIHAHLIESGAQSDIFVANTLLAMYAKCGSMADARQVFERMLHRDVVSWNAMIMGYTQRDGGELALQLYARMQHEGFLPDDRTFVAALKACGSLAAQEGKQVDAKLVKIECCDKGRAIHSEVTKRGLESSIFIATTLVDMYVKCGSMADARQVFERMQPRNLVSWTAMIMGYAQREEGELALDLYARMQHEGLTPDAHTFVAALKACSSLAAQEKGKQVDGELVKVGCLEKGRIIHSQLAKSRFESDIFVANTLVDMYAKCGSMVDALQVFEMMPHRDVVSWNAMIMGYAQKEAVESALQLYARMQSEGFTPNSRTFVAVLKACGILVAQEEGKQVDGELVKIGCLEKCRAIHSQIAKSGFEEDIFVANTLVDLYAKCGSMVGAHQVFEGMQYRDMVSWTSMIMGYVQRDEGELALQLYARMQHEGFIPDAHTFVAALTSCSSLATQEECKYVNGELVKIGCLEKGRAIHSQISKRGYESEIFVATTLVDMYAKCGSMVDARQVFDRMPHRDVVSWTAMIMGYAEREEGELALQLYACMQHEGFTPDTCTFVAALIACGSLASLETGKEIHAEIYRVGLEGDAFLTSCLIDMYGKCGSMVDAQRLFDASCARDVVRWSALIAGYSHQGDCERVFDLFERMQQEGIQPVGATFVSVLTVCSHAGLVDKGQMYFQDMCSDYGMTPASEHCNCMVDLLGRAGQLDEAVAMVMKLPFKPGMVTWMTILSACRKWNNVDVGRYAFQCAVRVDEKQAAPYALMTNIYVSARMWEESAKIQVMRMNARAWKKPGQCWWTDSAGNVHTFLVGDRNHSQSKDIYAKLKDLFVKMEEGYVPDMDGVLHTISHDEKDALCGHIEKLAIACALINTPPATPIRIVKNLQVCEDCHNATALISKIEQRVIICRDASRFHVYKDGKCSCGDFS